MPLKDALKEALGWSQYEASAYTVLVQNGPLEASDIALEADIPDARVYNVLSALEKRGCVLKQDKRPAIYDAQNPHYVIQQEQDDFIEESEEVEAMLENAWEPRRDDTGNRDQDAWVLGSASSTINEIRKRMDEAQESIRFVDHDLRWVSRRNDLDRLQELRDNDVDITIIGPTENALEDLSDLEADLRYHEDLTKAYYVIDEMHVIMRLSTGGMGIVFSDDTLAAVFINDFDQLITEATGVKEIVA